MLALTALSAVACCGSAEEPLAIIPVPQETVRGEGHFEMPEVVTYATDLTASEADHLAGRPCAPSHSPRRATRRAPC